MPKKRSLKRKATPLPYAAPDISDWWRNLQISERQAHQISSWAAAASLTPEDYILAACHSFRQRAHPSPPTLDNDDPGPLPDIDT